MSFAMASHGVFNRFELSEELGRRNRDTEQAVDQLDADRLLNSSTEDLVAAITSVFDVVPPEILWNDAEQLPTTETTVDVSNDFRFAGPDRSGPTMAPASQVTIAVPVTGNVRMLGGRAATFTMTTWPNTSMHGAELHVWNTSINPNPQQIKTWWNSEKQAISKQVEYIRIDIEQWRHRQPERIRRLIETRRARLLRDRGLEGALGLKVRIRGQRPQPVPVKRKKVATTRALKRAASETFHPEPELEATTYHEVLDIIGAFGRGLERSPRVAQKYDEEELRDQILVHLNGHFEGEAGGELFNGAGKTDILIRQGDRNVFIGECKFWEGPKKFGDAIDQLCRYMVWRDTKSAIILFIKHKDPTAVIEKAQAAIRSHPQYKRDGHTPPDPTVYTNYVLRHGDDDQREIRLALIPLVIRPPTSTQ